MSSEGVIDGCGLTKAYQIYDRPQNRLWQMLWRGRRRFYREFLAVSGVDLTVCAGETVGIVGRNGSGKSTLLGMICGTLQPTSGELVVRGRVSPLLTLGAGFNREFTGRENVHLNATILGLSRDQINERLGSVIDFADIGEFFDRPVKSYSAGMHSRLAFAVAMCTDPDILVIDEILAVGDEAFTRKCFSRIEQIKRRGATILFVSHSSTHIVELCDRALLLDRGERLLTADPKTVISRYKMLSHANSEEREAIRQEIRRLDSCGSTGDRAAGRVEPGVSRVMAATDTKNFDPTLQSTSSIDYSSRGARIRNPRVVDAAGEPVNWLRPGESYTYAYEVDFDQESRDVRFGMMLKPVSGYELSGQVSHPEGESIKCVAAGTTAIVRFPFRAALAPGVYFLNAGVLGVEDRIDRYLHRILDAVMIRVTKSKDSPVTGRVDLRPPGAAGATVELRSPRAPSP